MFFQTVCVPEEYSSCCGNDNSKENKLVNSLDFSVTNIAETISCLEK